MNNIIVEDTIENMIYEIKWISIKRFKENWFNRICIIKTLKKK